MPIVRVRQRNHSLAYATLAILFVISSVQWVRNTSVSVQYILHGETLVRGPFDVNGTTLKVDSVNAEARAAGLQVGDLLLSVDGRPVEGLTDYWGALRHARLGQRMQ